MANQARRSRRAVHHMRCHWRHGWRWS
jgi:hypothetical protein